MTNTDTVERLRELHAEVIAVRETKPAAERVLFSAMAGAEFVNALPALLDAVEAGEDALKRARPYRDGSGVIEIPMHVWAAFAGALATLKGEG